MKKVAVFTGTRAEYGLLYWLLKDIEADKDLDLQLIVSGMHLSGEFNNTVNSIIEDGFEKFERVEMLLSSDTPIGVAKSIGLGTIGYADALFRLKPDILIVLGDRFEALAVSQAALIMRIPILHIHGGEKTDGAYDDSIRHAISKFSHYHATSTESHRRRVIQLGEAAEKVWNVGSLGLEYIRRTPLLQRTEVIDFFGFPADAKYLLVTYHPQTISDVNDVDGIFALLSALDQFNEFHFVITFPNADNGGRKIITAIRNFQDKHGPRVFLTPSLGQLRYLSAMKFCEAVIGNSSSGIIEAPSLFKATVNVGRRQKGREAGESVIHCSSNETDIVEALSLALSKEFKQKVLTAHNPYGSGNACDKILQVLKYESKTYAKSFRDLGELGE